MATGDVERVAYVRQLASAALFAAQQLGEAEVRVQIARERHQQAVAALFDVLQAAPQEEPRDGQ